MPRRNSFPLTIHSLKVTGCIPPTLMEGGCEEMVDLISFSSLAALSSVQTQRPKGSDADLMGVFICGWADPGVHPETFWLGYATGPARGWKHDSPSSEELMSSFYRLFYGPGTTDMSRLYQLMSQQARFWRIAGRRAPLTLALPSSATPKGCSIRRILPVTSTCRCCPCPRRVCLPALQLESGKPEAA